MSDEDRATEDALFGCRFSRSVSSPWHSVTFLPRLDERGADALMSQVRTECESFGTTCIGADGVCSVCAGPSGPDDTCPRCRDDRDAYGDELADLVVPLAYTVASGGGAHHFRSYKTSDRDRSRTVLGRLLRAA